MRKLILTGAIIGVITGASGAAEGMAKDRRNDGEKTSENILEGIVLTIDVTPMFVDGAGEVLITRDDGKKMMIYINACEGPCSKAANDVLYKLKKGDHIRVKGSPAKNGNISIYDDMKHFFRIISDKNKNTKK